MAKHEQVKVWHTCDLCGQECEPVREIALVHSYSRDLVNRILLRVSTDIPYGPVHGDVCKTCLDESLRRYLGIKQ